MKLCLPAYKFVAIILATTAFMSQSIEDLIAQQSPEILDDGRVTFSYSAPESVKSVKAAGQFGDEVTLTKGEKNQWEGTTASAVDSGIFEYRFVVDGIGVVDPANSQIKPQRWPGSSILHIPADPPVHWSARN